MLVVLSLVASSGCRIRPPESVFSERVVVFMEATAADLELLRSEVDEDDFYIIADDLMYYRAEAHEFLEEQGWPVTTLLGRRPLRFQVNGESREYEFPDLTTLDAIVLFDPGQEPLALPPIDVRRATEYFRETLR